MSSNRVRSSSRRQRLLPLPPQGAGIHEWQDRSREMGHGDLPQLQAEVESNTTCMICMEDWTINTPHRICCLKCGHLFGRSCIERWIEEQGLYAQCPSCNKAVRRADIRNIWCTTVRAIDITELSELRNQLAYERRQRQTDALWIFHYKSRYDMASIAVDDLTSMLIERNDEIASLQKRKNGHWLVVVAQFFVEAIDTIYKL